MATAGLGGRKNFTWTDRSHDDLLSIARRYQISQVDPQEKQKLFLIVLERGMQQMGHHVDRSEIKNKWKEFKDLYRAHKQQPDLQPPWTLLDKMSEIVTGFPTLGMSSAELALLKQPPLPSQFEDTTRWLDWKDGPASTTPQGRSDGPVSATSTTSSSSVIGTSDSTFDTGVNEFLTQLQQQLNKTIAATGIVKDQLASTSGLSAVASPAPQSPSVKKKATLKKIVPSKKHSVQVILDGFSNLEDGGALPGIEDSTRKIDQEENLNGAEAYLSAEEEEPPTKKRKGNYSKKGLTNTDRIIDAMVLEGQKDRAILRQFMKEFSSSAKALTQAIQQIAAAEQDEGSSAEET